MSSHLVDAQVSVHIEPIWQCVNGVKTEQLSHRGLAHVTERPEERQLYKDVSICVHCCRESKYNCTLVNHALFPDRQTDRQTST